MPREGYIHTPDGVRLFYKVVGEGEERLIVLHGGPANSMDSILPDLEPLALHRTVIYYDQRGNGRSELIDDPGKLAISKHVEDLETVRRFFKLEKIAILGNSWGGMLAAFYAVEHPDRVERIVLHSPGEPTRASMVRADQEMIARLDRQLSPEQKERYAFLSDPQHWIDAADPKALCREYYQLLLPFYVAHPQSIPGLKGDVCSGPDAAVRRQRLVNQQIVKSLGDWDLLPSLGAVDSPALVIYGAADPAAAGTPEAWAKALPNSRLLLIDDAGHLPHVEQPDVFFNAVETFLKGDLPQLLK
jgi:proline-specific peptidase